MAVVGTFVLGLGDQVQTTAPNTNSAFDYNENHADGNHDALEVLHEGGDGVSGDELYLVAGDTANATTDHNGVSQTDEELFAGYDTVRAGDSDDLDETHFEIDSTEVLRR